MFAVILDYGVIYLLLRLFERREAGDDFDIADAAVIPCLVLFGLQALIYVTHQPPVAALLALLIFACTLFWVLWRNVKVRPWRAAIYSIIVVAVNLGVEVWVAKNQ